MVNRFNNTAIWFDELERNSAIKGGDFMAHDKVLTAVGKATQNILAEDCSNGNGSGLLGYMRNGMDFEVGDYDFWGKIAENVLKNLNYVGGDVSAHKNQKK